MNVPDQVRSHLLSLGLRDTGTVYYNEPPASLYELAIERGESKLAAHGPIVSVTKPYTGRSPNDRFVVNAGESSSRISWGKINVATTEAVFEGLLAKMVDYAEGRDLFVRDAFACADRRYRLSIRVINELA